jgi:hypothetical protein
MPGVVTYADGTLARGISIVTDPVDDEATILATVSAASEGMGPVDAVVIAEVPAGAMLEHDGGAGMDALAGPRLLFLTGAREADHRPADFRLAPIRAMMHNPAGRKSIW